MLKYNLKDFFKDTAIHNEEWASNGHFAFKKSILTAGQRKVIEGYPQDTSNKINQLIEIVNTAKKIFDESREQLEFIPEIILENYTFKSETFNILHNSELELTLKEEYYNFFISRGCKIYKGSGSLNPTLIFKDSEFVGVLLPVRIDREVLEGAISYNSYITRLKQEQKAKDELKKLNKKCLYISNNKAVVRNIPLRSVAELTGDEKYNNLYVDAVADQQGHLNIYINLDIVFISLNKTVREDRMTEEKNYYFDGYNHVTLDFYKEYINESLELDRWINTAEVKLMELAGEPKEYIEKLNQHRRHVREKQDREHKARELKKQQEEQEYVDSKNKITRDIITQAEQDILQGNKVINKEITMYTDRWSNNTTSLILHMMKLYDIKIPLKTQGWINKALHNVNYNNGNWNYQYYKSSSDSTVFYKYLDMLVAKVKEKHKLNITA